MSGSLEAHGLQHARSPCPSLSPRVCPSSSPLNRWCHPTISSSVPLFYSIALFFCLQSFPASGSFPMSQLFASVDQSIGVSASASAYFSPSINGNHITCLASLIRLERPEPTPSLGPRFRYYTTAQGSLPHSSCLHFLFAFHRLTLCFPSNTMLEVCVIKINNTFNYIVLDFHLIARQLEKKYLVNFCTTWISV